MAGECSASPEAAAPAQSFADADVGEAGSNQGAQDAALPKTTGRDPVGVGPNVAHANGRDRSSVPISAGAPATPAPPAEMPAAARGSAEGLHCSRRFGLTAHQLAGSSGTRSNAHLARRHHPSPQAAP